MMVVANVVYAQFQVGFSAGVNLSNARDEINNQTRSHSFLLRPNAGLDVSYFFDEHWGLQSGLYYAGKGWRERYSLGFDTVIVKLNYVEVPLNLAYRFHETAEKNIIVSAGFYGSYGFSGKVTFRGSPELTYDPFKEGSFKRFDFGYAIESAYRIEDQYGAKLSYTHALLSLTRPDDKLKNYVFGAAFFFVLK